MQNEPTLSLCPNCYCMTKTIDGKCGKCQESKPLVDDINVTRKMQNEPQLSEDAKERFNKIQQRGWTECGMTTNTDNGVWLHKFEVEQFLIKELAIARAEGAQEERKKHIEIYRWLVGYYDFPERQDGMGAYWWRSHLMDKLKNIGIEALTTKEHHAS